MPDFLSSAWVEALDARMVAAGDSSAPNRLVIQYLLSDAADQPGSVSDDAVTAYHLALDPDGDRAHPGIAADADVTFTLTIETARQISDGSLSTEEAFVTGKLGLAGDPLLLIDAHRSETDPDA